MRRISITLAVLVAAAGTAAVRPDVAAAQDNAAVAVNTKDGSSVFRLAFSINRIGGDVVDNANAAVAVASCTECRTVALAIQVVLVTGDASVVTPTNLALAYNIECTACETLASAYQYVFDTDGAQVHFSASGNRALARIRQELQALRHSDLPIDQVQAHVDALMNELLVVLRDELVVAGQPPTAETPGTEPAQTEPLPTDSSPAVETEPLPGTTETTGEPAATEPTAATTEGTESAETQTETTVP